MTRLTKVVMEESKRYEAFVAVNSTSFACKVASNSTEARKLCDIYSLGNLTRCLIRARMFDRFLDANAMTLDVLSGLKSIESSADAIHIYQRQRDIRNSASHTSCGSRDGILRIVKEVEDSCTGLRLVDFVRVKSEM